MNFIWDTRRQHRIRVSRKNGIEITRGALVKNIPISGTYSSDPEVFIKALADSQCPRVGLTLYPSTIYPYNLAVLEEINPTSEPSMAVDQCRLEFVYRLTNPDQGTPLWTLTDGGQGSYIETNATALGTLPIVVWYKTGTAPTVAAAPADDPGAKCWKNAVRGMHKFYPQRTIRATTQMRGRDWNLIKAGLRGIAGMINSAPWGSAARGTWLFQFPVSSTTDYGASFSVEGSFLENPDGWFPVGLYLDRHGEHPPDSANPLTLLGAGPPPFDGLQQRNGIVRASVYKEADFNSYFTFTPDD